MTAYIQLTPHPLEPERVRRQRSAFRAWVADREPRQRARVLLVDPDVQVHAALRSLWAPGSGVEIIEAAIGDGQTGASMFRPRGTGGGWAPLTSDEEALRRRFPTKRIDETTVPTVSMAALLARGEPGERIGLLALDAASTRELSAVVDIDLSQVDAIAIDWDSDLAKDPIVQESLRRMREHGLSRAGKAWGEAGESILLVRAADAAARIRAAGGQLRSTVGAGLVAVRDQWVGPGRRAQVIQPVRVAIDRGAVRSDILDSRPGTSVRPPSLRIVEQALTRVDMRPAITWTPTRLPQDEPSDLAQECHARHGVWPISFSYPRPLWQPTSEPHRLVSPITPGLPYSFDDEEAYRLAYSDSFWGVTHRKAGWDCFRHVEILGAGALPWMIDAHEIPRYSMVHYPKQFMAAAAEAMARGPIEPDAGVREAVHAHAMRHLTSRAMAEYLLSVAGLAGATKLLFVDERLPHHADYQSMLTLIGLKQLRGVDCHLLHPVDYIYDDTTVDTARLYGRGFGYTRAVPGSLRSATEGGDSARLHEFDALVVGSITRNAARARSLLREFSPERTIWIHGEDLPPTFEEVSEYRRSRVQMFVRAIHVND